MGIPIASKRCCWVQMMRVIKGVLTKPCYKSSTAPRVPAKHLTSAYSSSQMYRSALLRSRTSALWKYKSCESEHTNVGAKLRRLCRSEACACLVSMIDITIWPHGCATAHFWLLTWVTVVRLPTLSERGVDMPTPFQIAVLANGRLMPAIFNHAARFTASRERL